MLVDYSEKYAQVVEWERGIGVADITIAPCRSIPITPAMLEAERRRQMAPVSTVADAWRKRIRSAPRQPVEKPSHAMHVQRPSRLLETRVPCKGRCGRNTIPTKHAGLCYVCHRGAQMKAKRERAA